MTLIMLSIAIPVTLIAGDKEEIITSEIDIQEDHLFRRNWGLFRDRRVDLYKELLTLDGKIKD